MAFGKYDALDKLIKTLSFTLEKLEQDGLKKVPSETMNRLYKHLKDAKDTLGRNPRDIYLYDEVMEHLYNFVDEVNLMEAKFGGEIKEVARKDSREVVNLLRPYAR